MKKCFIILLALMLATCCVGCMKDNGIEPLYENVAGIRQEIIELEKGNEKLEKDNIKLQEELDELVNMKLSSKRVDTHNEYLMFESRQENKDEGKLGITPNELVHYIFNLAITEKEYEELYIDSTPYKYYEENTTIYHYIYTINKKDRVVIFLELELAKDEKHIERIKLYYVIDEGDIKQHKLFKKYAKLISYAVVMINEDAKELNDDIVEKVTCFYDKNRYENFNRGFTSMGEYETFTITGY